VHELDRERVRELGASVASEHHRHRFGRVSASAQQPVGEIVGLFA
jgi:hypothetical protein